MTLSRRTRTITLTAAVLAGAGSLLVAVPAAATDDPLRLTTVAVPDRNTDLDLGEPGPGAGDAQVFLDDVQREGETVGTSAGSCTLTVFTETRLVGICTATLMLPEGTISTQGAFDEDPSAGPGGFVWAVTGGTGDYAGAGGEATGTFRPDTDIVDWEIDLR
ncbi:allene oxide cyclase barrel-like domain-containing protein [Modestobacter sp. URMC 112]